ncbi:MAG: hypothetical protein ABIS51_05600 [Sphingomonas sp.]
MKNHLTPNRRAFAALIPATLLLAVPAFAQDAPAAEPPVVQTAPPVAVTPPPVVPTVADVAPATPPAAEPATTTTATRTTTTTARARTAQAARPAPRPVRAARAPAPVEAAPAPTAPTAATPVEAPAVTPAPAPETAAPAAPAPEAAAPAPATTTETVTEAAPIWPWVLGLLIVLGAIGLFVMRRRRADEDTEAYYDEPYVAAPEAQPEPAPAPIRAEPAFAPAEAPQFLRAAPLVEANEEPVYDVPLPVAAEESTVAHAEAAEVAELTAADAPVADRPWLEFALRAVRAGISADEALVEIELTVGNSGSVPAKDVRISTFLFANEPGSEAEMERLLIERGAHPEEGVHSITIEPGEGARVDATLALPKAQLLETTNGSILPVVIADARYTLADGSEGRTSASFTIGVSEEGTPAMSPLMLADRGMHDEVEARLYGVPEHA